jgi:dTDP-glucose 4,6-dehydratase
MKNILITGGAGFIGSHVVRKFVNEYPKYKIFNLDALTYAGNLQNLKDLESKPNYKFLKGDITNEIFINQLFKTNRFEGVIHLAAESHVDRSIADPIGFAKTNIIGTIILLNAFKNIWNNNWDGKRFYHVSTDEVYGSLGKEGLFTETTPYDPSSPYSASKASSDHFVRAYGETYGMPYIISNCSNNYGANQFPEKLIPLFINNIINNKSLPVYGDGNYTRDWLFVEDHAIAIDLVFNKGLNNETYNIGGFNEWKNIYYLYRNILSKNSNSTSLCKEFDCDRGVLRRAISLAAYLGFKTIYLVGCDYLENPQKSGHWYENYSVVGDAEVNEDYISKFIRRNEDFGIDFKLVSPFPTKSKVLNKTYKELFKVETSFRENTELLSKINMQIFSKQRTMKL